MNTRQITLGGYVAGLLRDGDTDQYPAGVEYVSHRRNGSGTIITLAVTSAGADAIRENLTRRDEPGMGHSKDQRRLFAKAIEQLPTIFTDADKADTFERVTDHTFMQVPEPDAVEAPAPAPVIEATIEAEIEPVSSDDPAPRVIDPALVAVRVRTTLRLFWNRIPSLRGADFGQTVTAVTDRVLAAAADRGDIATALVSFDESYGNTGSDIFNALVIRMARDVGDNRPAKPAKVAKPKKVATGTLDATAKADAAEARLKLALAADPKARNIAALKAVATKLRREASGVVPVAAHAYLA